MRSCVWRARGVDGDLSASATLVSVVPVQCELFSVQRTTVDGGSCPLDGASDDRGPEVRFLAIARLNDLFLPWYTNYRL